MDEEKDYLVEFLSKKIDFLTTLVGSAVGKEEEAHLFQDLIILSSEYEAPEVAHSIEGLSKKFDFLTVLFACEVAMKSPTRLYKCLYLAVKKAPEFNEDAKRLLMLFDLPKHGF